MRALGRRDGISQLGRRRAPPPPPGWRRAARCVAGRRARRRRPASRGSRRPREGSSAHREPITLTCALSAFRRKKSYRSPRASAALAGAPKPTPYREHLNVTSAMAAWSSARARSTLAPPGSLCRSAALIPSGGMAPRSFCSFARSVSSFSRARARGLRRYRRAIPVDRIVAPDDKAAPTSLAARRSEPEAPRDLLGCLAYQAPHCGDPVLREADRRPGDVQGSDDRAFGVPAPVRPRSAHRTRAPRRRRPTRRCGRS